MSDIVETNIFGSDKIRDDTLIECPLCDVASPAKDWEESEVGCESCGGHPALRCPDCDESVDTIFWDYKESILEET